MLLWVSGRMYPWGCILFLYIAKYYLHCFSLTYLNNLISAGQLFHGFSSYQS